LQVNTLNAKPRNCADNIEMSFLTILPWVLIAVLLSVLAMVYGVSHDSPELSYWSAASFALFITILSFAINRRYWRVPPGEGHKNNFAIAAARNARLMGVCYFWGAVALLAIYSLTQLSWQHGWQYAMGMALFGIVGFAFAVYLRRDGLNQYNTIFRLARFLTVAQCIGAALGLVYLIGTGKMSSLHDDWAANQVFLFGGIAIVLLSFFSLRTNKFLIQLGS